MVRGGPGEPGKGINAVGRHSDRVNPMGHATSFYHPGNRTLQDRFDTRRLADRLEEVTVGDTIDEGLRDFIETRDLFFLSTVDPDGQPTCSYKGGDPGFVRVPDPQTLAWPNYDGNGMYLSMGNLSATGRVGILFIDFEQPGRIRVHGRASIHEEDPLLSEFPEAQFIVRVAVEKVFPNCPRYIHRMETVERSEYVPREGCETPVPGWKRAHWARDVLAKGDPANATAD